MAIFLNDEHFQHFIAEVDKKVAGNNFRSKAFLEKQKNQVNTLVDLEDRFKKELDADGIIDACYAKFLDHLFNEVGNLLYARPFFRERKDILLGELGKALKVQDIQTLKKYKINFLLIKYFVKCGVIPSALLTKYESKMKDIIKVRTDIIETNLPLAVSRAKMFWAKTPKSHMSYMDIIQVANEGLIIAIDKYVPPFSRVFRSVIIGRISSKTIQHYSETMVKFFPEEKKILYRANKVRLGKTSKNISEITDFINNYEKDNIQVSESQVHNIVSASSSISMSLKLSSDGENEQTLESVFASPVAVQPDYQVEKYDTINKALKSLERLSIFEQKIIKLKLGV